MQFSDSSTKLGIVQEVHSICNSDSTSYPTADITRRVNAALDDYIQLVLSMDKLHQWDDTNITTLPIATFNIVNDRCSYHINLDGGSNQVLKVHKVYVKDSSGNFQLLTQKEIKEDEMDEILKLNSGYPTGSPKYYSWFAGALILTPRPNYDSTAGGKLVYQRTGSYFTATDTTKIPGIPYVHHMYLARKAALPYLIEKQQPQKNDIQSLIVKDEMNISNFYWAKSANAKRNMRANVENTK